MTMYASSAGHVEADEQPFQFLRESEPILLSMYPPVANNEKYARPTGESSFQDVNFSEDLQMRPDCHQIQQSYPPQAINLTRDLTYPARDLLTEAGGLEQLANELGEDGVDLMIRLFT